MAIEWSYLYIIHVWPLQSRKLKTYLHRPTEYSSLKNYFTLNSPVKQKYAFINVQVNINQPDPLLFTSTATQIKRPIQNCFMSPINSRFIHLKRQKVVKMKNSLKAVRLHNTTPSNTIATVCLLWKVTKKKTKNAPSYQKNENISRQKPPAIRKMRMGFAKKKKFVHLLKKNRAYHLNSWEYCEIDSF